MNNDIICDKNWIIEISKIYDIDNTIESFSPNTNAILKNYEYGYTLHKHLKGYCFLSKKSVI
jgi:hypothetical protein